MPIYSMISISEPRTILVNFQIDYDNLTHWGSIILLNHNQSNPSPSIQWPALKSHTQNTQDLPNKKKALNFTTNPQNTKTLVFTHTIKYTKPKLKKKQKERKKRKEPSTAAERREAEEPWIPQSEAPIYQKTKQKKPRKKNLNDIKKKSRNWKKT